MPTTQDEFVAAIRRQIDTAIQNIYADTYQAMWREVGLELSREKALKLAALDTQKAA